MVGAVLAALLLLNIRPSLSLNTVQLAQDRSTNNRTSCDGTSPCQYEDIVQLRVIILAYNRAASLRQCLSSVATLEMDAGETVSVEVWVDRSKRGDDVDLAVLAVVREHRWLGLHLQKKHAGIIGQWLYSWRPPPGGGELALILEDDVDVSPQAWRWLKAVRQRIGDAAGDVAGYSIYEGETLKFKGPANHDKAFMFRVVGSQGFVPLPRRWAEFQDWYIDVRTNQKSFHPYVPSDPLPDKWYRGNVARGQTDTMWTIWFIYFCNAHGLYTVYPNIDRYLRSCGCTNTTMSSTPRYLAYHRRAKGLHFSAGAKEGRSSDGHLISQWNPTVGDLGCCINKYDYHRNVSRKLEMNTTRNFVSQREIEVGQYQDRAWIIRVLPIHYVVFVNCVIAIYIFYVNACSCRPKRKRRLCLCS